MRVLTLVLMSVLTPVLIGQDPAQTTPRKADEVQPANKERASGDERREYRRRLEDREVVVGAQVWSYPRIYPLLDGLLQDVAATQVSALTLNPNAANGSTLDALQQAFQVQFQYSQLAGVQNAATAQVAGTNALYQNQIAQQGAQLLQQFSQAVALATQAQSNVNTLMAAPGTNPSDLANAQQILTNANQQVTALGGMIASLKNSIPAPTVPTASSALASSPTLPQLGSSQLPSALTTAVTGGSPSFPATKQMDNQMDMLWERLSRLVGVMAKPDSMPPDDKVFLVKFDTGIYPLDRKKQLLDVTYKLSCGTVIDLFPRAAAINIIEDKYRDTAFGIGAVLNFFGIGSSVAYNREHLKVSQLLGQSSYITGHGVGQDRFGWLFGISLGDDSISPGVRTTFALVDTPKDCGTNPPTVNLQSEAWTKSSDFKLKELKEFDGEQSHKWTLSAPNSGANCSNDCVESIDFNRVEYDPTAGKAPVSLTIKLKEDMDQQQTVTVNGQLVQRVRDNFGRAVASGGTNGVLETSSLATNTWIPTNSRTILMTLDGSAFGDRFPQILLSSPRRGSIDVSRSQSVVTISGRQLDCGLARAVEATEAGTPAAGGRQANNACLPSLAFQKSVPTNMQIARWIANDSTIDKLSITTLSASASGSVTTASGLPAVQVISDQDSPAWGPNPEVDWMTPDNKIQPLTCVPGSGSRLVCDAPDASSTERKSLTLQVIDQGHPGGPIKGLISTVPCGGNSPACRQPLLWKTNPPRLSANNTPDPDTHLPNLAATQWEMKLLVVNVDPGDTATLGPLKASGKNGTIECNGAASKPCSATFVIRRSDLNSVSDLMAFQVQQPNKTASEPFWITNVLTNVRPWISQISSDFTSWYGENLVYDAIRINANEISKVQCTPDGTFCSVVGGYDSEVTGGLMYFVTHHPEVAFPFVQVNTSGANSPIVYTPPKPPSGGGAPQTASQTQPAALRLNGLLTSEFTLSRKVQGFK